MHREVQTNALCPGECIGKEGTLDFLSIHRQWSRSANSFPEMPSFKSVAIPHGQKDKEQVIYEVKSIDCMWEQKNVLLPKTA